MTWFDYVFAGMLLLMPPFFMLGGALAVWSKTAPMPHRVFMIMNGLFGALVVWLLATEFTPIEVGWEIKSVYAFAVAISTGFVVWRVMVIFIEMLNSPNQRAPSADA